MAARTGSITAKITALSAFIFALGALIDASFGLFTKVQSPTCRLGVSLPWCSTPDKDRPAIAPETDATRVHAFEFQTSSQEVKPGFRKWTRIAPDVWQQLYPDGTKEFAYKVRRINLFDCDGTIVSSKEDQDFQAFFPDKNCERREFMFRRLSQGTTWHSYVPIDHME